MGGSNQHTTNSTESTSPWKSNVSKVSQNIADIKSIVGTDRNDVFRQVVQVLNTGITQASRFVKASKTISIDNDTTLDIGVKTTKNGVVVKDLQLIEHKGVAGAASEVKGWYNLDKK